MFNRRIEIFLDCRDSRIIVPLGVPFPNDEELEKQLIYIDTYYRFYSKFTPENFQIKMPPEFRDSIFAKSFITKYRLIDDHEGQFICGSVSIDESFKLRIYYDQICTRFDIDCGKRICYCGNIGRYNLMEIIRGFNNLNIEWVCYSCAKKFGRLKTKINCTGKLVNSQILYHQL